MRYLVIGAGQMATAIIFDLLTFDPASRVVVVDRDPGLIDKARLRFGDRLTGQVADAATDAIESFFGDADAAISAVPYFLNLRLADIAVTRGVHFCDLGGNTDIVFKELDLDARARSRGVHVIPDCGLSPGMTNILAAHAIAKAGSARRLEIRVGGLPVEPRPPLNYQRVFSVHGLINEYVEPAVIVRGGSRVEVPSMTGVEAIRFDGFPELEAFYTHGGISTLPWSYEGLVTDMDEKTVRYAGHAAEVTRLLADSRFGDRDQLVRHFEDVLPDHGADVVLLRVTAWGDRVVSCELVDYADPSTGFTAMMRTTGFGAAVVAHTMTAGRLGPPGAHLQERRVPSEDYIRELGRRGLHVRETVVPER